MGYDVYYKSNFGYSSQKRMLVLTVASSDIVATVLADDRTANSGSKYCECRELLGWQDGM